MSGGVSAEDRVGGAVVVIVMGLCIGFVLGLILSGSDVEPISHHATRALGEEIAEGMMGAACIEARGKWKFGECNFSYDAAAIRAPADEAEGG